MSLNLKTRGIGIGSGVLHTKHERELFYRTIFRLFLTYLVPFILLTTYFLFQSNHLLNESRRVHLRSMAEYQANTLDLFLRERVVNLSNLIGNPRMEVSPTSQMMQYCLEELKSNSNTFVDVGYFDSAGVQIAYAGPYTSLEYRNYSHEKWYLALRDRTDNFIITDIYLGFRQKPHFTLAVSRILDGQYTVIRATLDPARIYEYITALEGAGEVSTSIVNPEGYYQVMTASTDTLLSASSLVPPRSPRLGVERVMVGGGYREYGYSWLKMADWALIVQGAIATGSFFFTAFDIKLTLVALIVILIGFFVITYRAWKVVKLTNESEQTKAQLEHAAKLASVGELAGGIAHEINNPLAIISEEVGLVKDLMSPEYGGKITFTEIARHLDVVMDAVYRCRDITRNLLEFVRRSDFNLELQDVNKVIGDVLDGFITREMSVSNIEIIKEFAPDLPKINTDKNRLKQVLLNIINNGVDAITGPGSITIATSHDDRNLNLAITDTGKGMSREELGKVFLPFYTTKEVGKGTGLGLSVSYGLIKGLGGDILVDSVPKRGSTFTIVLPLR